MKKLLPLFTIILITACSPQAEVQTPTATQAPPTLAPTQTPLPSPSPTPEPWVLEDGVLLALDKNGDNIEVEKGIVEIVEEEGQLSAINDFGRVLFTFEDGEWIKVEVPGAYDIEGWGPVAVAFVERFYPGDAAKLTKEGAGYQEYFNLARDKLAADNKHVYNQVNPHSYRGNTYGHVRVGYQLEGAFFGNMKMPGVLMGVREVSLDGWVGEHSEGEVGVVMDLMRTDNELPIPVRIGKRGVDGRFIPFIQLIHDNEYNKIFTGDREEFSLADLKSFIGEHIISEGPYHYKGYSKPEKWNVGDFWQDWGENWDVVAKEFTEEENFLKWYFLNVIKPISGSQDPLIPIERNPGHFDAVIEYMRQMGYIGVPAWSLRIVEPAGQ